MINAGSSDDLALTRAVNRGLAQRRAAGAKGVLVHVSGTRLVEGPPVGRADDTPVYNVRCFSCHDTNKTDRANNKDMDVQQIENIRETACHRLIDLE